MAEQKLTAEESFRSSLEDVVAITEKLVTLCSSTGDLCEMCRVALTNDGQLALLMDKVTQGRR